MFCQLTAHQRLFTESKNPEFYLVTLNTHHVLMYKLLQLKCFTVLLYYVRK